MVETARSSVGGNGEKNEFLPNTSNKGSGSYFSTSSPTDLNAMPIPD